MRFTDLSHLLTQQQQQHQVVDTERSISDRLDLEAENNQDTQEEEVDEANCEHFNGKVVKSTSEAQLSSSSGLLWHFCIKSRE